MSTQSPKEPVKKTVAKKAAPAKKRGRPAKKATPAKKVAAKKVVATTPAKKAAPAKKVAPKKAAPVKKVTAKKVAPVKRHAKLEDLVKTANKDIAKITLSIKDEIPSEVIWNDMITTLNQTKTSVNSTIDDIAATLTVNTASGKSSLFKRLQRWLKS
jgi:hypothetical protein